MLQLLNKECPPEVNNEIQAEPPAVQIWGMISSEVQFQWWLWELLSKDASYGRIAQNLFIPKRKSLLLMLQLTDRHQRVDT